MISLERQREGIGTLGEKTLHAVLKQYIEPNKENQEVKIGSFVADIANSQGIFEIQTRGFDRLRKKLNAFLKEYTVTIVYPIPKTKWLFWIDEQTGETTKKRKSPKQGKIQDIFFELYKIKQWLDHPNLKLWMMLLDVEEYRNLNGWSADKKRGSTRFDGIPVELVEEVRINSLEEYALFLPDELDGTFRSKDFKAATKLSLGAAQKALNILHYLNIVKRVGKEGNAYIYERNI